MTTMEAALAEIHAEAFGWALACCRRDRFLAEEVLHVAYVKVLEGSARFDERSSFKTFLFGVIRNTAMEQRRADWLSVRRLTHWFTVRPATAPTADPEAVWIRSERAGALSAALARLSNRQREVLHLVFYQDLTIEEAAQVLGITTGSARTHYERGKARLRDRKRRPGSPGTVRRAAGSGRNRRPTAVTHAAQP
jgi:RNA polymerase sigma-70 factor (ECF subfamily)